MKKLFTSIILLTLGVVAMQAANYELYVCGTQVTDANKNNIMTGVTFDGDKTLTLNNVTMNAGGNYAIYNKGIDGLIINIIGTCTIKASNDVFYLQKNTIVTGGISVCATLNVKCESNDGATFWVRNNSWLSLYNLWLTAEGSGYCIYGDGSETLFLSCCVMTAKKTDTSNTTGAVHGFSSFNFDEGDAYLTTGAVNSSKKAVCESSTSETELIEVKTDASLIVGSTIARIGENTYDLSPKGLTSGTITWENSSKTLTLDAVDLTTTAWNAILNNKVEGFKIKITGVNSLKGASGANIYSKTGLTIEGNGASLGTSATLNISDSYTGIFVTGNDLTIKDAIIGVTTIRAGISGDEYLTNNLIVKNSLVLASGKNNAAIYQFKNCTLTDCCTSTFGPVNYCWRSALHGFGTATALAKGDDQIVAIAAPTEWYDVYVMGTRLSNLNSATFATDGLEAGTITYNKTTKKLTLDNVTLTKPEGDTNFGIETLSATDIELIGDNNITSDGTGLALEGNTTISGKNLNVTSTSYRGIGMWAGGTLTIDCGTLYAKGKDYGYFTNDDEGKLVLKKNATYTSDYTFEGSETAAIGRTADLTLNDMDFYTDVAYGEAGCYFDADAKAVLVNGGAKAKKVNIYKLNPEERYGIFVGGTEVTNCNQWGVGSKYITAGGGEAVTYDPGSKVLTLNSATIDMGSAGVNAIKNNSVDGLQIWTSGNNTINANNTSWSCLNLWKNTEITGNSLNLTGANGSINANNAQVHLNNINMNISADIKTNGGVNALQVSLPNESKKITVAGSVTGYNSLLLSTETKILEPEGAYWDAANKYVTTGSGAATGVVFANINATGIEGVLMNDADLKVEGIYDAQGRQLQQMQQGVNILRMSDGTTRKVVKQ